MELKELQKKARGQRTDDGGQPKRRERKSEPQSLRTLVAFGAARGG